METGVPGAGNGAGREKGAAGKLMTGGKDNSKNGGVNFYPASAQYNPDPRKNVGKPAPKTKTGLEN